MACYFQGICDGGSAVILASQDAVNKHNLTPLAEIIGYGIAGVDPTIMGIGPIYAVRNLMQATSMKLNDVDLFEVNIVY